jgi:hypothetical protein
MANEPLGIYEELQRRRQYFDRLKTRIQKSGPTQVGSYAQPFNPFIGRLVTIGKPYFEAGINGKGAPGRPHRQRKPEAQLGLNIIQVVQAVCLESGLTPGDLMSPSHARRLAVPRHVAMWAADLYCPEYSLPQLGYFFDRDHTSVYQGIARVNRKLMAGQSETVGLVAKVKQHLEALAHGQ